MPPRAPRVLAARPNLEVVEVAPLLTFVTDVLEFTTVVTMGDGPDFALVERDGVSLALVASDRPGIPSTTTCYVDVDDVDALHATCVGHGADVVVAVETHPWGMRDFVVATPGGHRMAIGERVDAAPTASFSPRDFSDLSALVLETWNAGVDRDWSVPAGTLEWSCWTTADHTIDCIFSYAFFLASRRRESYPPFGELHALPDATAADLVDGLRSAATMLSSVIATADPGTRAVIGLWPHATTGTPADFAARGALEMMLHAYDVCAGLGLDFDPPRDVCRRLREHTWEWPGQREVTRSDDAWSDLLARSGRTRV